MGQVLRPESIGSISKSSNTIIAIASSFVNIGGRQYSTDAINISTGTSGFNGIDTGSIAINSFYYIYMVKTTAGVGGVISLSSSAPTGFTAYKLVGQCTTDTATTNLIAADKIKTDDSPIGHIVSAMLTESQFRAIHGAGWALADSRSTVFGVSVSLTKYGIITGATSLPDLRGVVLRGKNNSRSDGNQNPAGERSLGDFENDQMQGHRHSMDIANDAGTLLSTRNYILGYTNPGGSITGPWLAPANQGIKDPTTDNTNGIPRTGLETRMKNVTVNYFIKIN